MTIESFLRQKSKETYRTYKSVIEEWCRFLGSDIKPINNQVLHQAADKIINVTQLQASLYRNWLDTKTGQAPRFSKSDSTQISTDNINKDFFFKTGLEANQTNSTIAKKLSILRRIYRLLIASEFNIRINPFDIDRIPTPKINSGQKRPTEMVDYKVVKKMLDLPDVSSYKGLQDKTILSLLFGAGLRRSELVNLKILDFKKTAKNNYYIILRATKSGKDYNLAVPKWVASLLTELITVRIKNKAQNIDPIFISFRGYAGLSPTNKQISTASIYNLFKKYAKLADAKNFISPHSARATAITKLLDQGFTHREVIEFSRHSSIQMVEVYDKKRKKVDENPSLDLEY